MAPLQFRSKRISKTSIITLHAPLNTVFPLFGPIREKEWADGWNPEIIYSTTNLVEEHMIFKSKPSGPYAQREPDRIWIISKYYPEQASIEYTVFTPERLWYLTIRCREQSPGTTQAEITYTFTGLTKEGNEINEEVLRSIYSHDLKNWERAINHYLKAGEKLKNHGHH